MCFILLCVLTTIWECFLSLCSYIYLYAMNRTHYSRTGWLINLALYDLSATLQFTDKTQCLKHVIQIMQTWATLAFNSVAAMVWAIFILYSQFTVAFNLTPFILTTFFNVCLISIPFDVGVYYIRNIKILVNTNIHRSSPLCKEKCPFRFEHISIETTIFLRSHEEVLTSIETIINRSLKNALL